jgi:hypothetical protein
LFLFSLEAAHRRSEETMRLNHFDSTILGTNNFGQGSVNAVDGTHRSALRTLVYKYARRLSLRLGSWRALVIKRAAATAIKRADATACAWWMTPVAATCPNQSDSRRQREQRWMPGVVVGPGTVGVC